MAFKETDYGRGRIAPNGRGPAQPAATEPRGNTFDDRRTPERAERTPAQQIKREAGWVVGGLGIVVGLMAIGAYIFHPTGPQPFPRSGDVVVSKEFEGGAATAKLLLRGDRRDAVVQLLEPEGLEHAMTIYIRAGQKRTIPVPPGSWRLRVTEGDTWYSAAQLFGPSTHSWLSRNTAAFTKGKTDEVDLAHAERLAFSREKAAGGPATSALDAEPGPAK